jgi:hypothetical protein
LHEPGIEAGTAGGASLLQVPTSVIDEGAAPHPPMHASCRGTGQAFTQLTHAAQKESLAQARSCEQQV